MMMKIYRPLWSEGVFLSPEQFQQQGFWESYTNQQIAKLMLANAWGVEHLLLDMQAFQVNRLSLSAVAVRFNDGTVIDSKIADALPPSRDLVADIPNHLDQVTVFLALPLLRAQGGNCLFDTQELERPLRYRRQWAEVADMLGTGNETIAVLQHAAVLLFDFEDHSEYVTCPIARLTRDSQGRFVHDTTYLPPLLNLVNQSGSILKELELLCIQMHAKRQRLMGMRHERNQQMAEFAVADVSLFWLLNALNTFGPQLIFLYHNPTIHPENLYRTLVSLAGALITFSLNHTVDDIPLYQHDRLTDVLPKLFELVRHLLEESLPSRVIKIELTHDKETLWSGSLNDGRVLEDADFYLSVRSRLPGHQLQTQFPLLCKAGAPDDVRQIIHSALSGIPIKPLSHVPAAIPMRLENHYFALDLNHPSAKNMLMARCCEFYVPRAMPDISLELFAVLRS